MQRKSGLSKSLVLAAGLGPLSLTGAMAQSADSNVVALPEVDVVSTTPLSGGSGQDIYSFPSMVQTVTPDEFATTRSPNVTDTLQQRVPGVFVDDINGNPFSQELQYRGFYASPQQGTPQGLAVYQNGMRINEPFGDTVNWDLIPPQAIARTDIFTANPIFGLNALGGAISIEMKNGFNWQGTEAQLLGGSYGRVSGYFEYGKQVDNYSIYVTADAAHDGGWRYFSPSTVVRAYGDLGYRTPDAELHFIANGATEQPWRRRPDAGQSSEPKPFQHLHLPAIDGERSGIGRRDRQIRRQQELADRQQFLSSRSSSRSIRTATIPTSRTAPTMPTRRVSPAFSASPATVFRR